MSLLAAVLVVPKSGLDRLVQAGNDTVNLRDRSAEFADALKQGRVDRVFRLFNATFRAEITPEDLDTAIRNWTARRPINRIVTTHIELYGITGLVSSDVYFDASKPESQTGDTGRPAAQEFMFQDWVRTDEGWELMWLNKIMNPYEMDYGRLDTASAAKIVQLALTQITSDTGLERLFRPDKTSTMIVLLDHGPEGADYSVTLPGRQVVWLTRDQITALHRRLNIRYYVDSQPLRVLKNVAMGNLDIVPLVADSGGPRRPRSVKLIFVRRQGSWTFADYGRGW